MNIQYTRRFLKGFFIATRIFLSYKFMDILGIFLSSRRKTLRMKKLHKKNASLIREKAIEMKGVMIKVGQFLSSRVDVLPDEYTEELSQLQDQVPPHDFNEIRKQLINELHQSPEDLFSTFIEDPIAAASLGQVHRAVLKDGQTVAVKIQYPEIEKIIETDIKMFGILVTLMRGRYGRINLSVLHEEFARIVRGELDYIQEGKNAERFKKNFKDYERIIIPSVKWDFTRKRILTLEFVGGIKISESDTIRSSGIDGKETVNLVAEAYSKMIFIDGFFHGDPHPGNIFVMEGPKLVFVDFGMVQAIPQKIKRELRKFANSIVERNSARIIDSMEQMGFIIEGADYSALSDVAESMLDKYRDITPAELKALTIDDISEEIEKVLNIVKYIQVPNNFILLGRTIGILNGISYRLNPEINIVEIGKPYIKEFLKGSREEQIKQLLFDIREKGVKLWELPSQLHEFLSKANRGELSLKLAKSEMQEITGQSRAMQKVMMLVILTVTTAASSLFFIALGNNTMSLITAGGAVILGLLSVFRLMRS
jgi:predicted unusual protein kinase regulating ubiquinone biosynthesis (AarF/ABC1/UbiB family)